MPPSVAQNSHGILQALPDEMPSSFSARLGLFGGVDPPQHLLEMSLDRFIAEAGSDLEGVAVADHDPTAAGIQHLIRPEGLNNPAGIGASDPEQGGQLLMRQ